MLPLADITVSNDAFFGALVLILMAAIAWAFRMDRLVSRLVGKVKRIETHLGIPEDRPPRSPKCAPVETPSSQAQARAV